MNKRTNTILWIFSFVFTFTIAYYQRITGPSYPVKVEKEFKNQQFSFKLPRTSDSDFDEKIEIKVPVGNLTNTFTGIIKYKRFKSNDAWTSDTMQWEQGKQIVAAIPHQPPAGKVIYELYFLKDKELVKMTEEPVVLRFKGKVPSYILFPHILLMFLAMLFSTRTGLEALFKGFRTYRYSFLTLIFLFIGGGILGPIVQKYAFDAYWTGWPCGHDLTDTKTLVALVFWFIAFIKLAKNRNTKWWPVIAAVMLLAVYLIPHSVLGSEIDYTQHP
jgi:hypothetical protein